MNTVPSTDRTGVYRSITEKIIAAIEAGAGSFVMPWHVGPGVGRPLNAVTEKPYQGVNVVALWAEAMLSGFGQGAWATFKQWRSVGAQVRRGEHGAVIVFYKPVGEEVSASEEDERARRFVVRSSYVFNADQVDGWAAPAVEVPSPAGVVEAVEAFVRETGAMVRHGSSIACYRPSMDVIEMPERTAFVGSPTSSPTEAYYGVLLHELVHWSGARHRLARDLSPRFGSEAYAMEELVAELGAAFLCADLDVCNEPRPDHAAYLSSWLEVLRSDGRALFEAAKAAHRAAVFLTGAP